MPRSHFGHCITLIEQDPYKAHDETSMEEWQTVDYDHCWLGSCFLLIEHDKVSFEFVNLYEKPVYDYTVHTRSDKITPIEPKERHPDIRGRAIE